MLEPGGIIRGTVFGPTGVPVSNPTIWVQPADAKDLPTGQPPRGDAEGRFEVNRFSPGQYLVTVLSSSFAPWRQYVDFPGGELTLLPNLTLGGQLEITVLDSGGAPVTGAQIELRYEEDGDRVIAGFVDFMQSTQPTGTDGRLVRPRMPPASIVGSATLEQEDGSTRSAAFQAAIQDGATSLVTVTLP